MGTEFAKLLVFGMLPLDNQARYPGHWASGQSSYVLGIFCISSGRDNELGYPTVTCQTRAILPPRYPFPYVFHRENSSDSQETRLTSRENQAPSDPTNYGEHVDYL